LLFVTELDVSMVVSGKPPSCYVLLCYRTW